MIVARPSQVRARILENHGELRAKLEKLQQLAFEVDGGGEAVAARAFRLTCELFEQLADRLDIEEQLLVPLLREIDAWGELRADELVRHHELQWRELKALRARADGHSVLEVASELAERVDALRNDLLAEDRELLDARHPARRRARHRRRGRLISRARGARSRSGPDARSEPAARFSLVSGQKQAFDFASGDPVRGRGTLFGSIVSAYESK